MAKKERSLLSKLGPSDVIGGIISLIGIALTAYQIFHNGAKTWEVILCTVSQMLVILAWVYIVYYRYRGVAQIEGSEEKAKAVQDELAAEKQTRTEDEERNKEKIENINIQLNTISFAIKSNSVHLNEMIERAPERAEEQFQIIDLIEDLVDENDPAKIKIAQDKFHDSSMKFADGLFDLYKQYLKLSIVDIKRTQEAILNMRDCPRSISVTVKLLDKPFYSETDNIDSFNVYTAFRDFETFEQKKRETGQRLYSIAKNTGYIQCISKEHHILNNIKRNESSYMNENDLFYEYYNCTVTAPIKFKESDSNQKFFGFLCCECLNNDDMQIFTELNAHYLISFAQNLALFLETLDSNWCDRYRLDDTLIPQLPATNRSDKKTEPDGILEILYEKTMKGM